MTNWYIIIISTCVPIWDDKWGILNLSQLEPRSLVKCFVKAKIASVGFDIILNLSESLRHDNV